MQKKQNLKWINALECGLSSWIDKKHVGEKGIKIARIPEYWLQRFPHGMRNTYSCSSGVSLKFYTDSTVLLIHYSFDTKDTRSHLHKIVVRINETEKEYNLKCNDNVEKLNIFISERKRRLIEIILPHIGEITLYGIEIDDQASLSAYSDNRKKICFFGDSITHGFIASRTTKTYPYLLSKKLDMQLINHGYGGSAYASPLVALFLSNAVKWDILCIAIGTNTYGRGHESHIEYGMMYKLFIEIIRRHQPEKSIFCITPIWRRDADGEKIPNNRGCSLQDYRNAIQRTVETLKEFDKNLYLIDGVTLIDSAKGLSSDNIHPDDSGMKMIADRLYERISNILN